MEDALGAAFTGTVHSACWTHSCFSFGLCLRLSYTMASLENANLLRGCIPAGDTNATTNFHVIFPNDP